MKVLLHLRFPTSTSSIPPSATLSSVILPHLSQAVSLFSPSGSSPYLQIQLSGISPATSFDDIHRLLSFLYSRTITLVYERHGRERAMELSMATDVVIEGLHGATLEDEDKFTTSLSVHPSDLSTASTTPASEERERFDVVALGGTFDHIHSGHKVLLTLAAWLARGGSPSSHLIVGITDDVLLTKKTNRSQLGSLSERTKSVLDFYALVSPSLRILTPALQDIYGPTSSEPNVQALILTTETRASGGMINEERKKKGLGTLSVWVVQVVGERGEGEDEAGVKGKLGSTAIREWLASKADGLSPDK